MRLALESGIRQLKSIGLTAYSPGDRPDKAGKGRVADGFVFVGCYFKGSNVVPSLESRERLVAEVDKQILGGRKDISKRLSEPKPRRSQDAFIRILTGLDRKIRGWGDAYQFTTDPLIFGEIDAQLDLRLENFRNWFGAKTRGLPASDTKRAYGFAVLADTPKRSSPK